MITKTYILCIVAIVVACPLFAHAANITLVPSTTTIGIHQQFYVDVTLDTEHTPLNGIDGTITFTPDTLSVLRIEDGSSIVPLWIEHPHIQGSTITLAGIMPNGFNGTIDPFDQTRVSPGKVVRLVFAATTAGDATVSMHASVTQNNGEGTQTTLPDTSIALAISPIASDSVYAVNDTTPPLLIATRTRNVDLFDNQFTLVFSATDKESGVDHVDVREGNGAWKTVASPYLLEDQSDDATLQVRAVDVAGNETTVMIGAQAHAFAAYIFLALVLLIGLPFMVAVYKRYASKKK